MTSRPVHTAHNELESYLKSQQVMPTSAAGKGIVRALTGTTSLANPSKLRSGGFFLAEMNRSTEAPGLVMFLVTERRLIRYGWTPASQVTTSVPLSKVTAVELLEHTEDGDLLSVIVDASLHTSNAQYEERTALAADAENGETVTQGVVITREESITHRLPAAVEDTAQRQTLARFTHVLNQAIDEL